MDEDHNINYREIPIFKKGMEIYEVVKSISDLIPEEDDMLQTIKMQMIEDALTLSSKVAAAEGSELYDLKMESAALIRKAARDLMVKNHTLKMFDFDQVEYFQIVRDLLEEYRLLFIDWVAGFDKWDYIIDRWGLFNPPGIGPHDKDPDDDLPI